MPEASHQLAIRSPVRGSLYFDQPPALSNVKYAVCPACRAGLLYNIGFAPDWQFSGLGRLALRELETRHLELIWYTSGQHSWAALHRPHAAEAFGIHFLEGDSNLGDAPRLAQTGGG